MIAQKDQYAETQKEVYMFKGKKRNNNLKRYRVYF